MKIALYVAQPLRQPGNRRLHFTNLEKLFAFPEKERERKLQLAETVFHNGDWDEEVELRVMDAGTHDR